MLQTVFCPRRGAHFQCKSVLSPRRGSHFEAKVCHCMGGGAYFAIPENEHFAREACKCFWKLCSRLGGVHTLGQKCALAEAGRILLQCMKMSILLWWGAHFLGKCAPA